jgi:hypothetical protein
MNAILTDEPAELTEPGRAALAPLERLARRCLEKDPEQRFQSARDLAFALEAYGGSVPVPAVEIDPYLATLRADPRFTALMTKLRTECDGYGMVWRDLQRWGAGPRSLPSPAGAR